MTIVASAAAANADVATDPRLAAFCDPYAPEVFHSIANSTETWKDDPFDVETIHAEARAMFHRLLLRATQSKSPQAGKVLLLLGEAGSGKTHLLRAFRTTAHRGGLGYCGYMQMTTEVSNYARYMLQNLLDRLEDPYDPAGAARTGLARLSGKALENVPGLSADARRRFQEGEESEPLAAIEDYADRLKTTAQFSGCDLELLRALLHFQRNDPRVKNRVLMWLRCQDMNTSDRKFLGDIVPRTDPADAARMLEHLAKVIYAADNVPLVLLIDQLEDIANLSAPVEQFRKVVDAVASLTDQVGNAVVVMACLEDYFTTNKPHLTKAKQDRLLRDPEPLRLNNKRTLEEIKAIVGLRLQLLWDESNVEVPAGDRKYPFTDDFLRKLANLSTRDVLDNLRRHHNRCILAASSGEPVNEELVIGGQSKPAKGDTETENRQAGHAFDKLWNDFNSSWTGAVPDEDEELASVLAAAVRGSADELPQGYHFGHPQADGSMIEIEIHKPGNTVEQLLVAVCNKNAQGGSLARQITAVEKRAGQHPVTLVRTTAFPKGPKTKVVEQIGKLLKKDGRRVIVENADWRKMVAFQAFSENNTSAEFREWQRKTRPLGELKALQDILRLKSLSSSQPSVLSPRHTPDLVKPTNQRPLPPPSTKLLVGKSTGISVRDIELDSSDLIRHAAFLGGSGSGKTTAALNWIEQLLIRGVPVVMVDRKGDLARFADPGAWTPSLGDPARESDRRDLREAIDVHLFTPGQPDGRPLALPIIPPAFAELADTDREQFAHYAAAALGSMLGFKSNDADRQQLAILTQAILVLGEAGGIEVTVPALRELIRNQDDALVERVGGFNERVYEKLADRLLTLWLNNRALLALGNETLDIDLLLGTGHHARTGRTRLTILSTKFLAGADKVDFWIAQLLVAVGRWCARSPSNVLQAVFLFDEADAYLPATKQPATKAPMENLLKRARSAGVSIFLATQNPGDLDYRCRENVATWMIGQVREARSLEKLRELLAAAKGDSAARVAGQKPGQFHLARDGEVQAVMSNQSLIKTDQMSEEQIIAAARLRLA